MSRNNSGRGRGRGRGRGKGIEEESDMATPVDKDGRDSHIQSLKMAIKDYLDRHYGNLDTLRYIIPPSSAQPTKRFVLLTSVLLSVS